MTTARDQLIHLVYEINRELLMSEAGWRMDKCAALIESYCAAREAELEAKIRREEAVIAYRCHIERKELVERIVEALYDRLADDDADVHDICDIVREAARRKE